MNGHPFQAIPSYKDASGPPLYTIPIKRRPRGYGSWFSKIFFPIVFNLGILGINSAQFLLLPLCIVPWVGSDLFRRAIDWTKDGFGRLLIAITVLFAPTSLVVSADDTIPLSTLVERDSAGDVVRINLPDQLVVMSNHQAYLDWMYLWILACYCGHAEGMTILLKASLKPIPIVGWGMRFFRFIFLQRSWAADRANLTSSLNHLAQQAKNQMPRSPLWLLIFPEGTITSDDERAKSARYAKREGVDDFVGVLHPRSTGLLFCLRTLLPSIPDLQLLDVTISYPGVPFGKYPQEWYGLGSVFWRSVPPPAVRVHLHLYSNLSSTSSEIPSLLSDGSPDAAVASPAEARAFELWLRNVWAQKERRVERFADESECAMKAGWHDKEECEVVPIRQIRLAHWFAAFGGGGLGLVAAVLALFHRLV